MIEIIRDKDGPKARFITMPGATPTAPGSSRPAKLAKEKTTDSPVDPTPEPKASAAPPEKKPE